MKGKGTISIMVVDDDRLVADLLGDYLGEVPGFSVIGVAYSGNSVREKLTSGLHPDVIVLDLRMKDGNGEEVINAVISDYPEIRTVVISSYYQPVYLGYMFRLGANAFIPKGIDREELVVIIRKVVEHNHYFDDEQMEVLRRQMASSLPKPPRDQMDALTKREVEVLKLLCYQLTAKEIAEKLYVSKKTVETHKANLLQKTGARNIAGIIIYAAQNGFIKINEIYL